jgi:hypothetical protein
VTKTAPYEISADRLSEIEAGYTGGMTPNSRVFSEVFGHLRHLEKELIEAKADPALHAREPGLIQPDTERPGKFVFKTTGEVAKEIEAERAPPPPLPPGQKRGPGRPRKVVEVAEP